MAVKLRKMLGDINAPVTVALMRLIETQSQKTLAAWACGYARAHYLPIYAQREADDPILADTLAACDAYLAGQVKLAAIKPQLKAARLRAAELTDPISQASARAIATACAVCTTPTGALGFLFYGAAALAYDRAGLKEDVSVYERLADDAMQDALESLRSAAVPDEPNPAKIDWGC